MEIIPFIDVMFFLLATFMMVSLSMIHNTGVEVKLPKAGSAKSAEVLPDELIISINRQGEIFEGRARVTIDELKARLAEWRDAVPEGRVVLQGDYGSEFGKVVEVIDAVRAVGPERLLIRTEKPGQGQP